MVSDDEIVATLAYVDQELEKSAGFIGRNVARVKGFVGGYKNVGQMQAAQHGHAQHQAALTGQKAPDRPGFFQRLEQRFEGGMERGRAAGQLHDLQHHQQMMNENAQRLEQHTGQPAQYHQGPNYQAMDVSDLMHYNRDPAGYYAAELQRVTDAEQAHSNLMRYAMPVAVGGLAVGVGSMLRNRYQQQQPSYGYPPYGYPPYGYPKYGHEKQAFIGHFIPHLGINAAARAANLHSNLNEMMAHHGFQLGLKGHAIHPAREAALKFTIGPEALAQLNLAREAGAKLTQLSPDAQRLAMRAAAAGHDFLGMPADSPLIGPIRAAVQHHLGGTAPTPQAQGAAAKSFSYLMRDLTGHTYDPNKQEGILRKGLGYLRGYIPLIPMGIAGALDPGTALVHGGINATRGLIGQSRWGANFMKNQFAAGLRGEMPSKAQELAANLILSPAYYEAQHLGRAVRKSEAGIPASIAMQYEAQNRRRNMLNEPHMIAAAQRAVGPVGPQSNEPPPPPQTGGFLKNVAAPLAGGAALAGLGYSAYKGWGTKQEQTARTQDYLNNSAQNMGTPLPPMTVTASYDEFCEEKIANVYAPVYPSMQSALSTAVAQQLASKFVMEPVDAAHKVLQKKLYDEPKQQAAFEEAIAGDDVLQEAHKANPQGLQETFRTLKAFAPSMAKNPQATKSFLRQAAMSGMHGGGPDFATIRLLAETEKFIQNSKGRGTGS
jgi:hypothetical protein